MISYLISALTDWRFFMPVCILLILSILFPENILESDRLAVFLQDQILELLAIVFTVSLAAIVNFSIQTSSYLKSIDNLVSLGSVPENALEDTKALFSDNIQISINVAKLLAFIYASVAVLIFWGNLEIPLYCFPHMRCISDFLVTEKITTFLLLIFSYLYFYSLLDIFLGQARFAKHALELFRD